MPGFLEQMLQLHTRLRYKAVFIFQVAPISSSTPPPSQSPGICRNKPGFNSFCFLISELVPLAKQMFMIPCINPGWGGGGFN